MDLTSIDQVVTVGQPVNECFMITPLHVFRHFLTGIFCFSPHHPIISFYKGLTIFDQRNNAAGIFRIIQRVHHAAALIYAIPPCTKHS